MTEEDEPTGPTQKHGMIFFAADRPVLDWLVRREDNMVVVSHGVGSSICFTTNVQSYYKMDNGGSQPPMPLRAVCLSTVNSTAGHGVEFKFK
jgi:hypothetical protein